METVKQVFGVMFLGVAIWFLERVLPGPATVFLWGVLCLGSAVFLGVLDGSQAAGNQGPMRRLGRALGLILATAGVVLLVGAAAGANDPLSPLKPFTGAAAPASDSAVFRPVKSLEDVERAVSDAGQQTVILDFYADWCIECKHLERETFTDATVAARMRNMLLLRADVTANDETDQALLKAYDLFGPPAVLFFRRGQEVRGNRLVGFADAGQFNALLDEVEAVR